MSLFAKLKRRNVFRVGIAYVVLAWIILQVGDTLAPALHLPEWINSALAFFLILGFPLALFFAWAETYFYITDDAAANRIRITGPEDYGTKVVVNYDAPIDLTADDFTFIPLA